MCLANGGGGAILNHPIKLEGAQYSLVSTRKGKSQCSANKPICQFPFEPSFKSIATDAFCSLFVSSSMSLLPAVNLPNEFKESLSQLMVIPSEFVCFPDSGLQQETYCQFAISPQALSKHLCNLTVIF